MNNRTDCFAYKEIDNKFECHALTSKDCKFCKFYKNRVSIKNNPFYAYSYDDIKRLQRDIKKRKIKIKDVMF